MLTDRPPIPAAFVPQAYPLWVVWYDGWDFRSADEVNALLAVDEDDILTNYPEDCAELVVGWEMAEGFVPSPVSIKTGQGDGRPIYGLTSDEAVERARLTLRADRRQALAIRRRATSKGDNDQ